MFEIGGSDRRSPMTPHRARAGGLRGRSPRGKGGHCRTDARSFTGPGCSAGGCRRNRGAPRLRRGSPSAGGLGAMSGPPCRKSAMSGLPVDEKRQRRTVSRVLCPVRGGGHFSRAPVARRLKRPYPRARAGHPMALLFGLAPGGVCRADAVTRAAGELLPHRFTLTALPGRTAVCFLWHCPWGCPPWELPSTLPCGARTFLSPRCRDQRSPVLLWRRNQYSRAVPDTPLVDGGRGHEDTTGCTGAPRRRQIDGLGARGYAQAAAPSGAASSPSTSRRSAWDDADRGFAPSHRHGGLRHGLSTTGANRIARVGSGLRLR